MCSCLFCRKASNDNHIPKIVNHEDKYKAMVENSSGFNPVTTTEDKSIASNSTGVPKPDYRFSVGQLPAWAKKQVCIVFTAFTLKSHTP